MSKKFIFHVLWQDSLLALSKLREEVDLEKSKAQSNNAGQEKELEVSIRAKNNAWVIARVTRGKELYMVLEKANETLLYASDAVEKFSNRLVYISLDACKLFVQCLSMWTIFQTCINEYRFAFIIYWFANFFELCRYCNGAFSLN